MELTYLKCFVMIILCLTGGLQVTRAASLGARLTALENLLSTQVYLLRETIKSEMVQRNILAKKMNETIEMMERLQTEVLSPKTADKTDELGQRETEASAKVIEHNIKDDIVKEVSEMLVRHRRGLHEEKIARKKDKGAIMNKLEQMSEEPKFEIVEMKSEIGEMKAGIGEMKAGIGEMKSEIGEMKAGIGEMKSEIGEMKAGISELKTGNSKMKADVNEMTGRIEQKLTELKNEHKDLQHSGNIIGSSTGEIKNIIEDILARVINVENQITTGFKNTLSSDDLLPVCNSELITPSDNIGTCLKNHFSWIVSYIKPEIRLVDGLMNNEGRVELYYKGSYGTVCDEKWDDTDAGVACRMLGYSSGVALYGRDSSQSIRSEFGPGTGRILLNLVQCKGSERHLLDCPYDAKTYHCYHWEDAGVRCD